MTMLDDLLIAWGALNVVVVLLATLSWHRGEPRSSAFADRVAAANDRTIWVARRRPK
jgi:hypothetical protein